VSKHPTRNEGERTTSPPPPKPGLDERLTDLTVKTKKGIESHWKVLVGVLLLMAVVYGAVEIVHGLGEAKETSYHGQVYLATDGLRSDQEPDIGALKTLLADLEGTAAEKSSYKRVVAFLLARASGQKNDTSTFSLSVSSKEDDDPEAK